MNRKLIESYFKTDYESLYLQGVTDNDFLQGRLSAFAISLGYERNYSKEGFVEYFERIYKDINA